MATKNESFVDDIFDDDIEEEKPVSKKEMYQANKSLRGSCLMTTPPIYSEKENCHGKKDCNLGVCLDVFSIHEKTKQHGAYWLVKPSHLAKAFQRMARRRDRPKIDYADELLHALTEVYNRRKVPGDTDNDAWYTDRNGQYNYRVLAGTMTLYGLKENCRDSFLKEIEKLRIALEAIFHHEKFLHEYYFAAYMETKGEDSNYVKRNLIQNYKKDLDHLYHDTGTTFFKLMYITHKKEFEGFPKWNITIKHDIALDEIFLDSDALDLGYRLYGRFQMKYKKVLMLQPEVKKTDWIPRRLRG